MALFSEIVLQHSDELFLAVHFAFLDSDGDNIMVALITEPIRQV